LAFANHRQFSASGSWAVGERDRCGAWPPLLVPTAGPRIGEHACLDCSVLSARIGKRGNAAALVRKLLVIDWRSRRVPYFGRSNVIRLQRERLRRTTVSAVATPEFQGAVLRYRMLPCSASSSKHETKNLQQNFRRRS
jgi:hypothetical protein